jgi:hypothetical protein
MVSDIPSEDGKTANLFYSVRDISGFILWVADCHCFVPNWHNY